ncbi:MAG TPA: hypothetical protein DCM05_15875 [Elusimicrobia bacterium]|nr:hypothetical protein [Elusimicrobiota bacterium]
MADAPRRSFMIPLRLRKWMENSGSGGSSSAAGASTAAETGFRGRTEAAVTGVKGSRTAL